MSRPDTSDEATTRREPRFLRIIDRLSTIAGVIAGIAVMALLINVTIDVLARTFLGRPLGLTLELTTYWWMPVLVALGYALAEKQGEHITVTMLLDRLPETTKRYIHGAFGVIGALLVLLLAWFATVSAIEATEIRLMANSLPPLEYWPSKIIAALGLYLLAIQMTATTIRHFLGLTTFDDNLLTEADAV